MNEDKGYNKDNLIVRLTFEFAIRIIKYTEELEAKRKYSMANQLFRSGTSIGANVHEAQSAESRMDFIHKMKVADKEAHETMYWLMLGNIALQHKETDHLLSELEVIKKVLGKIITTSKA